MRRAIVFVVGAALLLLALLVKAPASLVDGRLDALSAGRLRLASATGTVWNGAGELRLVPGDVSVPVSWHIDAWPLLLGELRGTLANDDGSTSPTSFIVSTGENAVRNFSFTLPANSLLRAASVPATLATVGGNVGLSISELTRHGDRLDGQLALRWDQATLQAMQFGSRPSPRIALGDVRYEGTAQGNAVGGRLANAGGDVEISGTVSASVNGSARLDALVRPRPGIDAERATAIASALAAFGQPEGGGAYRITWAR